MIGNEVILDGATGLPLPCDVCGKPARNFVNVTAGCASSVPSVMKPRCEEHGASPPLKLVLFEEPSP